MRKLNDLSYLDNGRTINAENQTDGFRAFTKFPRYTRKSASRTALPRIIRISTYWEVPLIVFTILLSVQTSGYAAQDVTLQWVANSEPDLAGYRIYQTADPGQYILGPSSPNLVANIPAGPDPGGVVEYTLTNVPDGTWYWVLTAYDTNALESGPSNEVSAATLTGAERAAGCFVSTAASE